MNNFIRNGDFLEWPNGSSIPIVPGTATTAISGDLTFVKTGSPVPTITISRQQHPVLTSIRQGFPTYFLRVTPSFGVTLGASDKSYLSWTFVETLDRHVAQGAYSHLTFWAKSGVDREIVVRFVRTFGAGGSNNNGHTSEVLVTKSVQLTKGWRKYQVDCRFPAFPATYGTGATVEARIYLQGGSSELGADVIPSWPNASVDFSQVALTLTQIAEDYSTDRISSGVSAAVTTIFATDPTYGAVGNYTGTQNTAGTGTDNRAAIQAALNAAYIQGPGGVNDTVNNTSYRVVIPRGKYYISAPSDGTPSLVVPLKVELDFSEAELHFEIPPVGDFGHSISEPNPLWCAIKAGQMSGLHVGKMQIVAGRDQTYGGTWFGLHLDAIRLMESDISWITGGVKSHILGFTRGAGIRCVATYNTFIEDLHIGSCAFGVVQSYYGTAFSGYTRYRGNTVAENLATSIWINNCSFLGAYKKAIMIGVDGAYRTPAAGGFEGITGSFVSGGPVSISQCAFEAVGEESIYCACTGGLLVEHVRFERVGSTPTLGIIFARDVRTFSVVGVNWSQSAGATTFLASYTGPHTLVVPDPSSFVRVNSSNVSPLLQNININNTQNNSCKLVDGDVNVTRLPTIICYRAEVTTQMQGTSAYMQNMIVENDGGRIWSASTVGVGPSETVNGTNTVFTFPNGFTRMKPRFILADGLRMPDVNSNGTINWTWNAGSTNVTMATAPNKDLRAFF